MKKLDAKGDSRLIRCALPLRSLGLDELPQIFNVLRGEMSLVGPRPCVPYEYENYAPRHRRRFDAVPGLTGLWQVSGKNRTTFEVVYGHAWKGEPKRTAEGLPIVKIERGRRP